MLDFQFIRPVGNIHLFYISRCESTQSAIVQLIEQGVMGLGNRSLPIAIFSDDQRNGKGQQGKKWTTEVGKNVTVTIALPLDGWKNIDVVLLNKALSVCTLKPIQNFVDEPLFLKWPNDIVTKSHKLGGLLMEMTQVMNQKFLLLGIGINVNQENWESEPKATSLRKLNGQLLEVADVMDAILLSIDDIWKNMRDLKLDYRQVLWNMGEEVLLDIQSNEKTEKHEFVEINEIGGEQIRGIFHEVDEEGRIVVSMANGTMLRFHHGQVRLKF